MATRDFSIERTDLYQDMIEFIMDLGVKYFKTMVIQDEDQLQMNTSMRRKAQEEQATGTLFEDRQERQNFTTNEKGTLSVGKGTQASNNNKKINTGEVADRYQPLEQK